VAAEPASRAWLWVPAGEQTNGPWSPMANWIGPVTDEDVFVGRSANWIGGAAEERRDLARRRS